MPLRQPAAGVFPFGHRVARQHNASGGCDKYEFFTIGELLGELLFDARQRLLDRAKLQAGCRVGEPLPLQRLQLRAELGCLALKVGNLQIEVDIRQAGKHLPLLHAITRANEEFFQPPLLRDIHRFGLIRAEFGPAPHPLRQGNQGDRSEECCHHCRCGREIECLHLITPPRNLQKPPDAQRRPDHQPPQGCQRQSPTEHLQPVGLEHLPDKKENRCRDQPAVGCRGDRVEGKQLPLPLRQEGIFWLLDAQAPVAGNAAEDVRRLLAEVGDLQDVRQDVVAVVAEQRIGIEEDGGNARDKHHVEAELIEEPLVAVPPQEGGDGGDDHLDIHPASSDRSPFPLVGQHPAVRHVAVEAGREDEKHHTHLVALAAKPLAGDAVAKLMDHLCDPEGRCQPDPVASGKKLLKLRKLAAKLCEVDRDQQARRTHQHHGRGQRWPAEEPTEPGVELVENLIGVDATKPQSHHVGEPGDPLLPDPLIAAFVELRPLPWSVANHQP